MVESDMNNDQPGDSVQQVDQDSGETPIKAVKKRIVKKKAAKKKVAKKKVAKKKATSKKKAASKKKTAQLTTASVAESVDTSDTGSASHETANPTDTVKIIATATSKDSIKPEMDVQGGSEPRQSIEADTSSAELIIKTHPRKEEAHMGSKSSDTASFWPKVIFWLLIVVIGFSYIRSLAKHPGTETEAVEPAVSTTSSTEQATTGRSEEVADLPVSSSEVVGATTELGSQAESVQLSETKPLEAAAPSVETTQEIAPQLQIEAKEVAEPAAEVNLADQEDEAQASAVSETPSQESRVEPGVTTPILVSPETVEPPAELSKSAEPVAEERAIPQVEDQSVVSAPAPVADEEVQIETLESDTQQQTDQPVAAPAYSEQRAESVSRILKEFDELRNTAEADMKARHEQLEKERAMRESMQPGSPRYPVWGSPGNRPYNPYGRAYYPYGYGYPQQ